MGILARSIHVRVAQRGVRKTVHGVKGPQVNFCRQLRGAVRRNGERWIVLWGGRHLGVPVERAPGRGEEEATDAVLDAGLQQGHRCQHVDAGIEHRILDRAANAGLGRLVDDSLRLLDPEQLLEPG